MCSFIRLLLCAATLGLAASAHADSPVLVATRTLGQTDVHQIEFELKPEFTEPELLISVGLDLSALEAPLPSLDHRRMWLTTDGEGMRHLRLRLEGESPWVDAICTPTPDQLQGSSVPEPAALALVFALAAFAWVALRRHQQALATAQA